MVLCVLLQLKLEERANGRGISFETLGKIEQLRLSTERVVSYLALTSDGYASGAFKKCLDIFGYYSVTVVYACTGTVGA